MIKIVKDNVLFILNSAKKKATDVLWAHVKFINFLLLSDLDICTV